MSAIEGDLLRVGDDARVHVAQVSLPLGLLGHQLPKARRAGAQHLGGEHHHQAGNDGRPRGVGACGGTERETERQRSHSGPSHFPNFMISSSSVCNGVHVM